MAERPSPNMRLQVAERAKGVCEYCRAPDSFASDVFETEHVIPRIRGGITELENLAWACGGCNLFKGAKHEGPDPDSREMAPIFNPRHDSWEEHFVWSEDFLRIIGISASGRATVEVLRMNRISVMNLRRALLAVGQHPPI
ncbi:MAG: HNH endonuclease [Verrucomicrobiota bacterium]